MSIFQSLSEFCSSRNFTTIHEAVRENSNGYPFLTFISADNKAENVYFSKSMAENVTEGQLVDSKLLQSLQIAETVNANGETRYKLAGFGESRRLKLSDLLG
jgi:hypothetical protein